MPRPKRNRQAKWTGVKNMTPEERKPYNDKALTSVSKDHEDNTKKFTSLGISYAELDAEQRELAEAHNLMLATIKNTVANLDINSSLKSHKFFVCYVNYFYKNDHHIYYPAEVALAAFSLESGVLGTIHFFVDPGKIPLGYKFEAADWSTRTHGIPVNDPSWNEGIKDHFEMFKKVKDFLKSFSDSNEVPPIYTMFDSLNANSRLSIVKSALNLMCDAANEDPDLFRVYCLPHLFFEIRNKCSKEIPSVAIMKSELDKDVFSYARDLGCYYHEEKDLSMYCSLSVVTRWVFTICDHCCKHLGIKLILGRHVPKDTDLSESTRFMDDKYSPNKLDHCGSHSKPLTIIDHGRLKEQRAEQKRAQDRHLRESEKIRLPKSSYSNKIGARFSNDLGASSSRSSVEKKEESSENEWRTVRGKGFGRGRGFLVQEPSAKAPVSAWPVTGRGRAFIR
nr:protein maelstrom homolog isoform X1 [Halyomorpha halys]